MKQPQVIIQVIWLYTMQNSMAPPPTLRMKPPQIIIQVIRLYPIQNIIAPQEMNNPEYETAPSNYSSNLTVFHAE